MLQIRDISKKYITGNLEQMALDGVSLDLRDNEFVAILGPSGSGKTTLLNIIGGLDRYDTGDLIINGVTTRKYKDRDWDSYRNHTIGFVFQSYNLIPHQTVLANVELALTISGISRAERRQRAEEALIKVGLEEHMHKKPNQMSGGQMQRVAIARALVNDPDILLADEPTGALDSETSVQVMDLLKEVAKDRLVVMVTHNPELAEKYATRIVKLKDGKIISDSDPFDAEAAQEGEPVHKNLGKAHMSFLTALSLSFNNLWTKKARTILVAFAGSIGIIGIALILSLSNGVNKYIEETEENTLSEYPLQILQTSFDLSSMMGMSPQEPESDAELTEMRIVSDMFSTMDTNDLAALKTYLDDPDSGIMDYAKAVQYWYSLTPWIFLEEGTGSDYSVRQVCPSTLIASYGASPELYEMMGMNMNLFSELPADKSLYIDQYEAVAGRWPENEEECVIVLSTRNYISDYLLYLIGVKDGDELDEMMKSFAEGENIDISEEKLMTFEYKDFLGINFKVVPNFKKYSYDSNYKVWTDKSDDKEFMKNLVSESQNLKVVGVVVPTEDARATMLSPGVAYLNDLTYSLMDQAASSDIVRAQISDRKKNVITGKDFGAENDENVFSMDSLFTVDENAFADAFNFNMDGLDASGLDLSGMDMSGIDLSGMDFSNMDFPNIDLSGMDFSNIDLSAVAGATPGGANGNAASIDLASIISEVDLSKIDLSDMPELTADDMAKLFDGIEIDVTADQLNQVFQKIIDGYQDYYGEELNKIAEEFGTSIRGYFASPDFAQLIQDEMENYRSGIQVPDITLTDLRSMIERIMGGFDDFVSGYNDGNEQIPFDEYLSEYLNGPGAALLNQEMNNLNQIIDQVEFPEFNQEEFIQKVAQGYNEYAANNSAPGITEITESFSSFLSSDEGRKIISDAVNQIVDTDAIRSTLQRNVIAIATPYIDSISSKVMAAVGPAIEKAIAESMSNMMSAYSGVITQVMSEAMGQVMNQFMTEFSGQIGSAITSQMSGLTSGLTSGIQDALTDAFSFDQDALADAFKFNMTEKELAELMTSLMTTEYSSYENNLSKMGYANIDEPSSVYIYPSDFESKDGIVSVLDRYNSEMEQSGQDEKVVRYTDIVGTLMTSVTDIINSLSAILIAFVAISLVVSSIMIGVITYISVLERRKEIGILRAIGASKRNISGVFNAETFIIGLLAGLLGVGIARLLLFPANAIIHAVSDATGLVARLPISAAFWLVILSVVLTLIGGLIPSRKAAKSDPVTALRTE